MVSYDVAPLPGYPVELGTLLATLQDGTREWTEELGEPSEDALVWQPFPGGYSIGAIVQHIAGVEAWWIEEVALGRALSEADHELFCFKTIDVDNCNWPIPPRQPWAWYRQMLDGVRARTLQAVKDFPSPDAKIERKTYDATLRWILAHVVEHDSYHGGQAVMLNMMHGKMP